jgi:putative endonuclease
MSRALSRDSRLTPDIFLRRNGPEPVEGTESFFMPAWFHILRLKSGDLYVGSTTDIEKRYEDHCSGRACRTTKFDSPVAIVLSEQFKTFSQARQREAQVKHWSRAKKEALVSGDLSSLRNLSKSK